MKLCIDHADISKIRRIYEFYPADGVSTNPSILARTKRAPYEVLKEIRAFIGTDAELVAALQSGEGRLIWNGEVREDL